MGHRSYATFECPACGRRLGFNGGNHRRHVANCPPRLTPRLGEILVEMSRVGGSMSCRRLPSDVEEDFSKGRVRFTYADARILERGGWVTIDRDAWAPRSWVASLTPAGVEWVARREAAKPSFPSDAAVVVRAPFVADGRLVRRTIRETRQVLADLQKK